MVAARIWPRAFQRFTDAARIWPRAFQRFTNTRESDSIITFLKFHSAASFTHPCRQELRLLEVRTLAQYSYLLDTVNIFSNHLTYSTALQSQITPHTSSIHSTNQSTISVFQQHKHNIWIGKSIQNQYRDQWSPCLAVQRKHQNAASGRHIGEIQENGSDSVWLASLFSSPYQITSTRFHQPYISTLRQSSLRLTHDVRIFC